MIPDKAWWNAQTEYFKQEFLERLERDKSLYATGDSRVDGNSDCPRCGSPNYRMYRIEKLRWNTWSGQPRVDEPHYYGKHCYTCGYTYDPHGGTQ